MENPKIAQKAPYVMDMKAGTYYFCTCGESTNQPFCNGAHSGSEFTPQAVQIDEDKKVAWCGCKNSSNGGFCDGTHAKL